MNPSIDPNYFEKFIPSIVSLIITGLASVSIGIYFEKFKNKLTFLKYNVLFQPLATTSQNDYWGNIEVFHNKRIVNHLSFVTVEIQNYSNRDLENLNVDIWVDTQSQFLGVSGFYNESKNAILLESAYYNYYTEVLERKNADMVKEMTDPNHVTSPQLTNEVQFVLTNKKFHLPVFNRYSSITINLLVENFKGLKPLTTVSILHKSIKLILKEDKESEKTKTTVWMLLIGIVIFALGLSFLLKQYELSTIPIILCAILGLSYSIIGLGIYKFAIYIKRILS